MTLQLDCHVEDQVAEFALEGELDTNTAPRFRSMVETAMLKPVRDIVLFAHKLRYISSAGLRILLMTKRLLPPEGKITMIGASEVIQSALQMTGFDRFVELKENADKPPKVMMGIPSNDNANIVIPPITLVGKLETLKNLRAYVQDAAKKAELDERKAYWLTLAVDEIATNVIVHGYGKARREGDITAMAIIDPTQLIVTLEDTSKFYDPRSTPLPDDLNSPLEERETGGLGVYLALAKLDDFNYENYGGRNRNTFIMKRTPAL